MSISTVPKDIIYNLLVFMSPLELSKFSRTNREYYEIVKKYMSSIKNFQLMICPCCCGWIERYNIALYQDFYNTDNELEKRHRLKQIYKYFSFKNKYKKIIKIKLLCNECEYKDYENNPIFKYKGDRRYTVITRTSLFSYTPWRFIVLECVRNDFWDEFKNDFF